MEMLAGARILNKLLKVEPLRETCPASPEKERVFVRPSPLFQSVTEAEEIELKGLPPRFLNSVFTRSGSQVSLHPLELFL